MAGMMDWSIDPAHSSIEFAVKHMMFTTVRGRFKDVTGTIHVDEENPDRSSVEVEIDAASIDTGVEDRDNHLRAADFLDVERFPKITFRSKRVEGALEKEGDRFRVIGDLTIRDKTLEIPLEATYLGRGKGMQGEDRAGFNATTEIDRRDFGLMWNQALETGGILVGNRVRIEIEAQAVLQEARGQAAA